MFRKAVVVFFAVALLAPRLARADGYVAQSGQWNVTATIDGGVTVSLNDAGNPYFVNCVNCSSGSGGTVSIDGGYLAVSQSGQWAVSVDGGYLPQLGTINTTLGSPFQAGGSIGNTAFGISGTLPAFAAIPTVNLNLLNGAALDTSVNGLLVAQASTTSGEKGPLVQGAVTLSSPSYSNGQTSPLSLDTSGNLRVNVVSGGGANNSVSGTGATAPAYATEIGVIKSGNLVAINDGQTTMANSLPMVIASDQTAIPTTVASLPLPTGAATAANQSTEIGSLATIATNTAPLTTAQGAALSGLTGPIVQAYTASVYAPTANHVNPLWMNNSGDLMVKPDGITESDIAQVGGASVMVFNSGEQLVAVEGTGSAGFPSGSVLSIQGVAGGTAVPISGTVTISGATVSQGNPNTLANAWPVELSDGTNLLGTSGHPVRVDPTGITTQPVSAVSLPLPSGAATSALQTTGNGSLATIATNLGLNPMQSSGGTVGLVSGSATIGKVGIDQTTPGSTNGVVVNSSALPTGAATAANQATVISTLGTPMQNSGGSVGISGTLPAFASTPTVNLGTLNGAALDASVTGLQVAQGSTTSGQKGPLVQGAVSTSSPSYSTGQTSPLSLDTAGSLRVNVVSGGGANNSVGLAGSAIPTSNTLVGYKDGSGNLQPIFGDATNGIKVQVTTGGGANASVSTTGSAAPASATYMGVLSGSNMVGLSISANNSGAIGSGITVLGAIAETTGTTASYTTGFAVAPATDLNGRLYVVGGLADNTAAGGNPVAIAAKGVADGSAPSAVSAGALGYPIMSLDRRLYVDTAHPNFFSYAADAVTATTQLVGLSGASVSYYIDSVVFSSSGATNMKIISSTTAGTACVTAPVVVVPTMYLNAAGAGVSMTFPTPIKVTANSAICCSLSAANASSCVVTGHLAP